MIPVTGKTKEAETTQLNFHSDDLHVETDILNEAAVSSEKHRIKPYFDDNLPIGFS